MTLTKEIVYDRESRDYAMYLDGELTGFARTYHEAEVTLDQLVFDLLTSGLTHTAAGLDGGADPIEIDDPPLPNEIPGTDPPHAGRSIARCWHRTPRQFIATLRQLDEAAWYSMAAAYAEWRGTTADAVLTTWLLAVQGAHVPANARS